MIVILAVVAAAFFAPRPGTLGFALGIVETGVKIVAGVLVGLAAIAVIAVSALDVFDRLRLEAMFLHLRSRSEVRREAAANALGKKGSYAYDERLAHYLERETSPRVRIAIVKALTVLGKKLLADAKSKEERGPSGGAALTIEQPASTYYRAIRVHILPGMIRALHSTDEGERDAAVMALKDIGTPEALAAVNEAFSSRRTDDVRFTAYYPNEVQISARHDVFVYAHLETALEDVEGDIGQRRERMGGGPVGRRTAKQATQIAKGTPVTVTPECAELGFEPMSITKEWNGSWVRFSFAFQPDSHLIDEPLLVRISVSIRGIEVASMSCPMEVVAQPQAHRVEDDTNPLAMAKRRGTVTAHIYENIFVSYSRSDSDVVEAYRFAQTAIGNDAFMDTYSIRTGEDWQAALARAIDRADIFQLFWSRSSAQSDNVRDEWNYALHHRDQEDRGVGFIRPVFWKQPLFPPPQELSHLNFRYSPMRQTELHVSDEE